jgi:replicative DNA helicase
VTAFYNPFTMPRRSKLKQLVQRADAVADGAPAEGTVATGFPTLDKLLGGGMRRGDLVVLGGDVGVGKSALALAFALRASEAGRAVEFYTAEMEPERVLERALAIEGRASIDQLRGAAMDDETRSSVGAATLRLHDRLPKVARLPAGGSDGLARAVGKSGTAEMVVVDPLQHVAMGALAPDEEHAHAVRRLKDIAVRAGVALLVTSHLPALPRGRENMRPTLDDFGALGAVKQLADVVLGLYRDELYAPAFGSEGATELSILKNRTGPTTYIDLYYYKRWLRFEDMVDPDR